MEKQNTYVQIGILNVEQYSVHQKPGICEGTN